MKYYIYLNRVFSVAVSGTEAAWAAYSKACEFAECVGLVVTLVSGETGEVIAENEGEN